MIDGKYEYFAFISYKEEDATWAKWLQRKLEHYKLPTALRKENPDLPERISPIYEYKSEAGGGRLKEVIWKGLTSSKYLIVICSLRATKSEWLNNGIRYFVESGQEGNIIPFIVEGKPKADSPEEECFPSELLKLTGDRELRGININEMGRDAAAVKVVSQMFDVKFDLLWQRYKREQRKKKWQIICFIAFLAVIAIAVAVWMWHLNNQLGERNRSLTIENIRIGSREVISQLEKGEYVNARRQITQLAHLWDNDYRIEAPEFEQAMRAVFRYANNDGIAKLYSIPFTARQFFLESDSSSFYLCDQSNGLQDEILQYDIQTGDLFQKVFLPGATTDTIHVIAMRGDRVLYSETHSQHKRNSNFKVYNVRTGCSVTIGNHFCDVRLMSDQIIAGYYAGIRVVKPNMEVLTIKGDNIVCRDTLSIPFFPERETVVGDSLIFLTGSQVAIWDYKTKTWLKKGKQSDLHERWQSHYLSEVNSYTKQYAARQSGLSLLSIDDEKSLLLDRTMINGCADLSPSGRYLLACDPYKDSLTLYACRPRMSPVFRIPGEHVDVSDVYFVCEGIALATSRQSSKLYAYRVAADNITARLYSTDATCKLDLTTDRVPVLLSNDDKSDSILTFSDVRFGFLDIISFSPHRQNLILCLGTDGGIVRNTLYLVDYHKDSIYITDMSSAGLLPDPFDGMPWNGVSFSNGDSVACCFVNDMPNSKGGFLVLFDLEADSNKVVKAKDFIKILALSPDASQLAISDRESVSIFPIDSLERWQPLKTFGKERYAEVVEICYSQDGKSLLGAYSDGSLRLWDAKTGLQKYATMYAPVSSEYLYITMSDDCQYALATCMIGPDNYCYYVWHIPSGTLVDHLTNDWSSLIFPAPHYFTPHYQADFCVGDNEKIVVNEFTLQGYSRIFPFPSFENLLKMYQG